MTSRYNETPLSARVGPAIALHLGSMGYAFERTPDRSEYRFRIKIQTGELLDSRIVINERGRFISCYVHIGAPPPTQRSQLWMESLMTESNHHLAVLGWFARGVTTGPYYQTSVRILGEVCPAFIEGIVNTCAFPVEVFIGALRFVQRRHVTPLDALKASLIEHNALEGSQVDNSTRRALLTVLS